MTMNHAKDKAARLLRKRQGSISSSTSNDHNIRHNAWKAGSVSSVSFADEPEHDYQPPVRMENTFQMAPGKRFPQPAVKAILREVLESYLSEEKYEPELCRQMTKSISEVVKARVKEMLVPRYKVVCIIHIGQLNDQGLRIGSRCLWDPSNDTSASFEMSNGSLFAVGTVYGVYAE